MRKPFSLYLWLTALMLAPQFSHASNELDITRLTFFLEWKHPKTIIGLERISGLKDHLGVLETHELEKLDIQTLASLVESKSDYRIIVSPELILIVPKPDRLKGMKGNGLTCDQMVSADAASGEINGATLLKSIKGSKGEIRLTNDVVRAPYVMLRFQGAKDVPLSKLLTEVATENGFGRWLILHMTDTVNGVERPTNLSGASIAFYRRRPFRPASF